MTDDRSPEIARLVSLLRTAGSANWATHLKLAQYLIGTGEVTVTRSPVCDDMAVPEPPPVTEFAPGYARTATRWKDWRGQEYGQGDRIAYATAGGSITGMSEGVVLDLYHVKRDSDRKWVRAAEDEVPPGTDGDRLGGFEVRIKVQVTRVSDGYAPRTPVVTLTKADHVLLTERAA